MRVGDAAEELGTGGTCILPLLLPIYLHLYIMGMFPLINVYDH